MPRPHLIVCPVCGTEKLTVSKTCSRKCGRVMFPSQSSRDPTPEEIKEACEKIQATWSETVKANRQVGSDYSVNYKTKVQPVMKSRRGPGSSSYED